MKKYLWLLLIFSCIILCLSANSQVVTLNYNIPSAMQIRVSRHAINLNLNWDRHLDSRLPASVQVDSTYDILCITTSPKRILAKLEDRLPDRTTLRVTLHSPQNSGTSLGPVELIHNHPGQPVVTGLNNVSATNLLMLFEFSAEKEVMPGPGTARVTFTITD